MQEHQGVVTRTKTKQLKSHKDQIEQEKFQGLNFDIQDFMGQYAKVANNQEFLHVPCFELHISAYFEKNKQGNGTSALLLMRRNRIMIPVFTPMLYNQKNQKFQQKRQFLLVYTLRPIDSHL
ncbi:hypothetical protein M9H77_16713 [Catharanthus roseus]|uniref:Uncharacterized protein n=1 Tax=Catharanthus roseus TaxID=4058 RepID=A0ACC0B2I0_CATRO|nr:hypothetical protein M9H77_16713 [Catharanthus roseus]